MRMKTAAVVSGADVTFGKRFDGGSVGLVR